MESGDCLVWSRLRNVARMIVFELGKNAPSGDYYGLQGPRQFVDETKVRRNDSVDLASLRGLEFIHFASPQQSPITPH